MNRLASRAALALLGMTIASAAAAFGERRLIVAVGEPGSEAFARLERQVAAARCRLVERDVDVVFVDADELGALERDDASVDSATVRRALAARSTGSRSTGSRSTGSRSTGSRSTGTTTRRAISRSSGHPRSGLPGSGSPAAGTFELVLIGKDGGVKARADDPDALDAFLERIDTMPMRRAEMRRAGGADLRCGPPGRD